MSTIRYLSTIKHTFYQAIHETKYIQKPSYDKIDVWYECEPKVVSRNSSSKSSPNSNDHKIIYHKKLHDVFFMLMDPLKSKDDMLTEFFVSLDKHKELLKELTPHYKKLQRDIVNYMSNRGEDSSYTNEKCMRFWASLLNSKIVFIEKSSYKMVLPTQVNTDTKEFVIKLTKDGFEYINTTLINISTKMNLHEKIDSAKLSSKSVDELKDLCKKCKIELPSKIKKADIVSKLFEVLI